MSDRWLMTLEITLVRRTMFSSCFTQGERTKKVISLMRQGLNKSNNIIWNFEVQKLQLLTNLDAFALMFYLCSTEAIQLWIILLSGGDNEAGMMPRDSLRGQRLTVQKGVNSHIIRANFGYGIFGKVNRRNWAAAHTTPKPSKSCGWKPRYSRSGWMSC